MIKDTVMKIYISLLLMALLSVGCSEFLEKEPLGNPTGENFYGSLNELQLGVNAIYDVLADNEWQACEWLFGSGASDECHRTSNLSAFSPRGNIMQLTYTPENIWLLKRWELNYRGIFRANQVITNVHKVKIFENGPDAKVDYLHLLGQAKFLRAFFYFNLVKTYGGVPIKPEVLAFDDNGNNFTQQRNTKEEVYAYIEKDLREAILLLKPQMDVSSLSDEFGKAYRSAALSYLIKVLAYQAKPGVNHPNWLEALKFSEHIIDRTPVTIGDILNLSNLYSDETLENISERLFISPTLKADSTISSVYSHKLSDSYDLLWHSEGETSSEWIFFVNHIESPSGDLNVGSSFSKDLSRSGFKATVMQPSEKLNKLSNDPRVFTSLVSQSREVYDGMQNGEIQKQGIGGGHPEPSKLHSHKWSTLSYEAPKRLTDNGKNFGLMRYAELLLFHAEALNETGNPIEAVDILNQLRVRAQLIPDQRWPNLPAQLNTLTYLPYAGVRDMIWDERQLELNCEFDRFWDIVRTGRAQNEISEMNSSLGLPEYVVNFTPGVHEVFAIPQNEIDLSNGLITQNPGH